MFKIFYGYIIAGLIITGCGKGDYPSKDVKDFHGVEAGETDGTSGDPKSYSLSVWHWGSKDGPYGINTIILDDAKSKEVLFSYQKNSVNRVYGGYSKIPGHPSQRFALARWNEKLQLSGIQSIFLIGNAKWIYPSKRSEMIEFIKTNYIDFNSSFGRDAQLKGLHLDIEPHQLQEWKYATLARKRELLLLLGETFGQIRDLLVAHGRKDDEIMADIPTWFDDSEIIGWNSESEKESWFRDISKDPNGLTIMAYELQSIPTIIKRTQWERDNFNGTVQIGLNADEIGTTWSDRSTIFITLREVISQTKGPVALHDYSSIISDP